jgi:lipopolysaccharide biosynthesis regulator YciM
MDNVDIKKLIDNFIEFVDAGSKQPIDRERNLMLLLDSLGLSQAYINFDFDENDYPDPPSEEEKSIRERICRNFQDYGYYNCAEEIEEKISETYIIVGDAIDDLVDIYKELSGVRWRWENTSIADALWHYDHMYRSHWGSHLRNLQLYVFNKQYGA